MTATGNVSRALHSGVVQLVSSFLHDAGLPAAPRPYVAPSAKLSDALAAEWAHGVDGDVRGLDGIYANVTTRQSFRPWDDLDRARTGAHIMGRPVGLFIQWRSGRSVDDSIVVLSLTDFAKLIGGTPPAP
ncbi:hypothetical protein [Microbacterium testaceum]|uniref:hypothetical protein n=1 Tax=Microbacterium testaceum TaxID=2033 RepID=UPI0012AD15D6|nr:hypothetical protein [Microbacterium testaceum]